MTIPQTLSLPLVVVEVGDAEEDVDVVEVGAELQYPDCAELHPTFLRTLKCFLYLQFKSCSTTTLELGGIDHRNFLKCRIMTRRMTQVSSKIMMMKKRCLIAKA